MLSVTDLPGAHCSGDVFMDSGGSFIHTVDPILGQLQVLAFESPSDLRHVQTLTVPGLKRALISNGDSHVYAATNSSLPVFERDGETGVLTQAGGAEPGLWNLQSIVISSDDRYLFAFDDNGRRSNLFLLEDDPSSPHPIGSLPPFWNPPLEFFTFDNRCGGMARRGGPAVDLFCKDSAFGVQWQPETGVLAPTDLVAPWQPDRFNNPIPEFGHTRTSWPVPMAGTPTSAPKRPDSSSSSASESAPMDSCDWKCSPFHPARSGSVPFRAEAASQSKTCSSMTPTSPSSIRSGRPEPVRTPNGTTSRERKRSENSAPIRRPLPANSGWLRKSSIDGAKHRTVCQQHRDPVGRLSETNEKRQKNKELSTKGHEGPRRATKALR